MNALTGLRSASIQRCPVKTSGSASLVRRAALAQMSTGNQRKIHGASSKTRASICAGQPDLLGLVGRGARAEIIESSAESARKA